MAILSLSEEIIFTKLSECQISKICRSCLTDVGEMQSVFSSNLQVNKENNYNDNNLNDIDLLIDKMIYQCTQIKISADDGLPQYLCQHCIWQCTIAHTFLKQCEKSNYLLMKFMNMQSSPIKEEIDTCTITNVAKYEYDSNGLEVIMKQNTKELAKKKFKRKQFNTRSRSRRIKRDQSTESSQSSSDSEFNDADKFDENGETLPEHFLDKVEQLSSKQLKELRQLERKLKAQDNDDINKQRTKKATRSSSRASVEPIEADGPQQCSICQEIFPDLKKLAKHRKVHGKKKHQCPTCGNGFTTTRGLRIHIRLHTGEKPEICKTCERAFSDPRALRDHQLSHSGEKPFECTFCDKKFAQKKPLQFHLKTHTGERPYVCDVCGKSYIQPNNLVIHKRIHTGEKPFICKVCNKAFTNGASLSLHMPVHTGVKDFICTICGKRMARSGELTIHMRTHTGEKPYKCSLCTKAFIKSSSLQAHMPTHTGEKKYVCPICGKRVAHAGKLTVHIRTHSTEKPLACPVCDKRFANSNYLKQHSKIHTGEKHFHCNVCGRGFSKSRILNEHMRTHTGERPFICNVCGHAFAQSTTLKTHMKTHNTELSPRTTAISRAPSIPLGVSHSTQQQMGPLVRRIEDITSSTSGLSIIQGQTQEYTMRPVMNNPGVGGMPTDLGRGPLIGSQHPDPRAAFDPRLMGFLQYPI